MAATSVGMIQGSYYYSWHGMSRAVRSMLIDKVFGYSRTRGLNNWVLSAIFRQIASFADNLSEGEYDLLVEMCTVS